jgi:hypothetical protein
MLGGLYQNVEQKGGRAGRVEPLGMGFVEAASRKIVDESKNLVGFAYATRRDVGRVSCGSQGVTQESPLGNTGLITEQ